jgi:hypothetical protein
MPFLPAGKAHIGEAWSDWILMGNQGPLAAPATWLVAYTNSAPHGLTAITPAASMPVLWCAIIDTYHMLSTTSPACLCASVSAHASECGLVFPVGEAIRPGQLTAPGVHLYSGLERGKM